jgi:hypothetical protein
MTPTEVVFCGKSIYISGLASCVGYDDQVRIIKLESAFSHVSEEIKMLRPDVVIFQLDTEDLEKPIKDFMNAYPQTGLVGLTPDDSTLTVFSGAVRYKAPIDKLWTVIMDGNISNPPGTNGN